MLGVRCRVLGAVITALLVVSGCSNRVDHRKVEGKLLVVASIAPMADFAREIGGDKAVVEQLVPSGASPHTFEPNPRQMQTLAEADIFVVNGYGLEFWADKAIEAAGNPRLKVIDASQAIHDAVVDEPGETEGHDHSHPQGNPHFWLDPMLAMKQVDTIARAFIAGDPDNKAEFEANATAFKEDLAELDTHIKAEVGMFRSRDFVAQHPAWVYFARRYGLKQVAVIEESPGKEPSTAYLRKMCDAVRQSKARAIFAEPQLSPKAAQVIGEETGVEVLILDPIGAPPHEDYLSNMRYNLGIMKQGM